MIKLFYDKTMSFFENLCRLLLCEESENGSEGNLAAITGIPAGISGMCFLSDTEKTIFPTLQAGKGGSLKNHSIPFLSFPGI